MIFKIKKAKKRSALHTSWRQMPCCRAFNQINIGVLFMLRGKIEFANRQMCAYLKKEAAALYGKSWQNLFRGNESLIRELKKSEQALNESDCCYYLTEKSVFPHYYEHRIFKIMCYWIHPQNKAAGICYVFQDITDLILQKRLAIYERASTRVFELLRQLEGNADEYEIFYRLITEILTQYHLKSALFFTHRKQKLFCSFALGDDASLPYDLKAIAQKEAEVQESFAYKALKTRRIVCAKNISKTPFYQACLKQKPDLDLPVATGAFPLAIRHKIEGVISLYGFDASFLEPQAVAHLKQLFHEICLFVGEQRQRKKHRQAVNALQEKLKNQIISLKKNKETLQKQIAESNKLVADLIIARNQAVAAGQAQMNFLANISHELRTPLNAVLGFAQMMSAETFGPLKPPVYQEYVSFIQKSANHLLGLINDILDLSRAQAGKAVLNESIVDLKKSLQESLDIIRQYPQAAERIIRMHFRGNIRLKADERALKQIFLNILSNAVKFTKTGGHIDIYVQKNKNGVQLVFQDNGIGIAAEKQDSLFKPFAQIENVLTRSQQGSGLGLVLIKKMVILHQGEIFLESQEGVGTKLSICFPKARLAV